MNEKHKIPNKFTSNANVNDIISRYISTCSPSCGHPLGPWPPRWWWAPPRLRTTSGRWGLGRRHPRHTRCRPSQKYTPSRNRIYYPGIILGQRKIYLHSTSINRNTSKLGHYEPFSEKKSLALTNFQSAKPCLLVNINQQNMLQR